MTVKSTDAPGKALLTVTDLSVSYPSLHGRRNVVDNISFELRQGEVFGLVGESGSGKTTTAMAILRLIPSPGRIEHGTIDLQGTNLLALGKEALRLARWRDFSLVPQGAMSSLNPVIPISEQIEDVFRDHDIALGRKEMRERAIALLASVGLPERVYHAYAHELSGGMKQRVCIAIGIALNPRLVIADEPTSALDVVMQRNVMQTLQRIKRELGLTLLMIGHDMGLQAQVADRIGIMYRGKLVEVGTTRDIFKDARHPYTKALVTAIPVMGPAGVRSGAGRSHPAWTDIAPESIGPLREVAVGHLVAE